LTSDAALPLLLPGAARGGDPRSRRLSPPPDPLSSPRRRHGARPGKAGALPAAAGTPPPRASPCAVRARCRAGHPGVSAILVAARGDAAVRWAAPLRRSRRRSDPRAAALDMVAAARLLARLVALLDHVVKLFAGGEDMGGAGLGGSDPGLAQRSASGGNPRSSDQSMVAFSVISSLEASVWSFFVVIDSCLLVRGNSGGNPKSGSPGLDDGGVQRRSPTCGRRFWS
jgi:hypothetical protein